MLDYIISFLNPSDQTKVREVSKQFLVVGDGVVCANNRENSPLRKQVFAYLNSITPISFNATEAERCHQIANLRRKTAVIVKQLLASYIYIASESKELTDYDRAKAIQDAVTYNNHEEFSAFLSSGPISSYDRGLAIRLAAIRIKYDATKWDDYHQSIVALLASGFISRNDRETAIFYIAEGQPSWKKLREQTSGPISEKTILALLASGPISDEFREDLIKYAARNGHYQVLAKAVGFEHINETSSWSRALFHAAMNKNGALMLLLLLHPPKAALCIAAVGAAGLAFLTKYYP